MLGMILLILHHTFMSDLVPGFVKVTDAGRQYKTSRSTLDRRREAARLSGNTKFDRVFRLRTKDGEVFERPSKEQVTQLTKEGRVPEWFVSRSWLAKEFGKRSEETKEEAPPQAAPQAPDTSSELLAAVRQQFEDRINDLKDQLQAERQEKRELMQYAQADKQMFAKAAQQLTQVLALPAINEANKNRNSQSTPTQAAERDDANRAAPSKPPAKSTASKRRRWKLLRILSRD